MICMQHFYVFRFNKWKRWAFVVAAAMFTALIIWMETSSSLSVFSSKEKPAALTQGSKDEPNIALTFNISWGDTQAIPILDELKEQNVKATFFVSGEWAERHPQIVDRIVEDKHELGMMGYRYKSYIEQEPAQIRKDLSYAKEIFRKLGHEDIELVRAPTGDFTTEIIQLSETLGLKVIQYSVNPQDWRNPGTQLIVDEVMEEASNGDIIQLHASDSVKQTEKALETILPALKNKGYHYVTVSELIAGGSPELKEVN